jgi:uncharacterized membrane protein YgdD (TMEM256/DUF423 family)
MNLFLLALLAAPLGCLALFSLLAFVGVLVLGGALYVVGAIKAGLRPAPSPIGGQARV